MGYRKIVFGGWSAIPILKPLRIHQGSIGWSQLSDFLKMSQMKKTSGTFGEQWKSTLSW